METASASLDGISSGVGEPAVELATAHSDTTRVVIVEQTDTSDVAVGGVLGTAAVDTEQFTFAPLPADGYTDAHQQLSFLKGASVAALRSAAASGEASSTLDLRDCFTRWGMHAHLVVCHFSFDRAFAPAAGATSAAADAQAAAFLRDFFNAPCVRDVLRIPARGTGRRTASAASSGVTADGSLDGTVTSVHHSRLPCTATSMSYFDRVCDSGIVTTDAHTQSPTHIRRRMEDIVDGLTVGDDLRAMCLCDEDAHAGLYSDAERRELLFRIFALLVGGGPMSQYDDTWLGYVAATREVYRDLIRVVRGGEGPDAPIVVASCVYMVDSVHCGEGGSTRVSLFPFDDTRTNAHMDVRDACYVCIHPHVRQVTLLYRPWVPYW